jgi:hypothetical protein
MGIAEDSGQQIKQYEKARQAATFQLPVSFARDRLVFILLFATLRQQHNAGSGVFER